VSLSRPDVLDALADAPVALGSPPATGRLRSVPEDFVVEERLGFEPDGAGPHVLLVVEKRGANTGWVAAQLARLAGVAPREVGWAGHKDRNALTRQAYTLPWPAAAPLEPCLAWSGEGYRVLAATRHGRKLRPGSHRGNRFSLLIRELAGAPAAIEARLAELAARGVPNYFGPQRFGRGGANLARARDWAAGGRPPRARDERAFALSAARSTLFNAVLAERVRAGTWERLLPGEVAVLEGRRSFFPVDRPDATLAARCAAMDLHPSGPLHGRGATPATGEAGALEAGVLAREAALCALLESQGLEQERRPLRLPVAPLNWSFGEDLLSLDFELPRGTFATAVLHEVLADAWAVEEGGD
jgi:tRNA pseudouridine13 synthase